MLCETLVVNHEIIWGVRVGHVYKDEAFPINSATMQGQINEWLLL